jgi:GntR family transcriptional regulator / MocR family aminotransferase
MLLSLDGSGPRYAQITRALCGLIQQGILIPGARMPASRELARDLGCSRNLVLLAYEQLVLEGYLVARQGGGTYVSPELPARSPELKREGDSSPAVKLSRRGRLAVDTADAARPAMARRGAPIDFIYGLCEPDPRAIKRMRNAFAIAVRTRAFSYGPIAGDHDLRQQLADRLLAARGIVCSPAEIIVTNGFQQALDMCSRLLLDPGDRVVVEDPGYPAAQAVLAAAGAEVIRVPVDEHGLDLTALPSDRVRVRAMYVTPSHQFPTGAVMPAARRYGLLEWAKRRGVVIIEDDYDGEFRYLGRPIAALAALEPDTPVIYCGTFAKSLFPSLRLGYMKVPKGFAAAASSCKWLHDLSSSLILQRMVATLMATGEYDRHVRRMQRRYRTRRQSLLSALRRHLGDAAEVHGSAAGLHVAVWLPQLPADRIHSLITACTERGVGVYSISDHATCSLPRPGLLLAYGLLESKQIEEGIRLLGQAYHDVVSDNEQSMGRRTNVAIKGTKTRRSLEL